MKLFIRFNKDIQFRVAIFVMRGGSMRQKK